MKLFQMLVTILFVTVLGLLVAPEMSAEPSHFYPAGVSSLAIFIVIGLLCLVIGLGLRTFSKPSSDLSINQTKKQ